MSIDYLKNIENSIDQRIDDTIKSPVNTQGIIIKSAPLAELVRVFNISTINPVPVVRNSFDGRTDQTKDADKPLYLSQLGTPVMINLKFIATPYIDFNLNRWQMSPEMIFDTVLCSVHQQKRVVYTEIEGRGGTVKEYIGLDDYEVSINGIITGSNRHYPADEVRLLKNLLEIPASLNVASSFLNQLGIHTLTVDNYEIPQEAGGYSQQRFNITALSDAPAILQMSHK